MQNELAALLQEAKASIVSAKDPQAVEQLRVQLLGKKGSLTALLKSVSDLPVSERPEMGKVINQAKQEMQTLLAEQDALTQ